MRALLVVAALALAQAASPPRGGFADLAAPTTSDERGAPLDGWFEITCARCHADVAEEWASTLHARAWVDETYREEIADARRPESCHNCHIPEPLHVQVGADGALPQKPTPRDATLRDVPKPDVDAHFGISCETCHRGADGEILGPYGAPTDAHKSRKHASFLPESKSALCIACHATNVGPVIGIAKDFADGPAAKAGKSCVDCHMAPVDRPAAVVDGVAPFPSRAGRSHALQTPRDPTFLRRAFDIRTEQRGDAVVVVIANASGHRVPGRIGRVITISAELLDAAGAVVAAGKLVIETKRSLAADGQIEIELRGAGTQVRVVGMHDSPALPGEVRFLELLQDLP